ncbi:sigma-70 family RNA polymerase sigma factor [Flagellimonas sp. DF-77]|uniref:RNA polymerase sigma factor n=1 Tax=Flagellimonas algarum TaxID=3230298 RepID=UPI003391157C
MTKETEQLQNRLRKGDKQALEEVYLRHKKAFLLFFASRSDSNVDLEDLYQDSVIAMYQNFVLKKLQLKTGSLQTYLFAIGKNKMAARVKHRSLPLKEEQEFTETFFELDGAQLSREQELLIMEYPKLGEKCKEMLRLYYYRGLTDKEIVEHTGYKDENTIKSYRSRCLKKLKGFIHGSK